MSRSTRPVLLVGSICLGSAEEVFEAVSKSLGSVVSRVPDGETGPRSHWTEWQGKFIGEVDSLEIGSMKTIQGDLKYPQFRPKPGVQAAEVEFKPLGYAAAALDSWQDFRRLRDAGKFRPETRFQVSLPTPFAVVNAFFQPDAKTAIWPRYEHQLFSELDEICRAIPHRDLAIQWDVASEIHQVLEVPGMAEKFPVIQGIARAANRVPADVEMGIHLCYGDPGHKHIVEPRDMGLMVDLANKLVGMVKRKIDWLHMPVPRDRSDAGYFAPLRGLKLDPETEVYLGLIHLTDGVAGTTRRITTARKFIANFGVATECGFGRRSPETIPALIELHRSAAQIE